MDGKILAERKRGGATYGYSFGDFRALSLKRVHASLEASLMVPRRTLGSRGTVEY